jgi:RNase H-fold protein (predicted Holliday junction resolvase)
MENESRPNTTAHPVAAGIVGVVIIGTALFFSYTQKNKTVIQNKNQINPQEVTEVDTKAQAASITITVPTTTNSTSTNSKNNLTKTDVLTYDIIQPYITKKKNDTYDPSSTNETIIQRATKRMFTINMPRVPLRDIKTTNDTTKQSVVKYKADIKQALQPILMLKKEYELDVYSRAIRDNDLKIFQHLNNIAKQYRKASKQVLVVTAPKDVAETQRKLAEDLMVFATVLDAMAEGYNDPAMSLAGLKHFTETEQEIVKTFDLYKKYFLSKKVSLSMI